MPALLLYGTPTSPFARRIRIIGIELGLELELVDTRSPEGQSNLRNVTPLWKVPVLQTESSEIILDSHAISDYLLSTYGPGPLRNISAQDIRGRNLLTVVDGALDSLINVMYLKRDGIHGADGDYIGKQIERATAAMTWLDNAWSGRGSSALDVLDIALVTTLEWMQLRSIYSFEKHHRLVQVLDQWSSRPSFVQTRPGD